MRIIGVALRTEDGKIYSLPAPARHSDLFQLEPIGVLASAEQGFLLEDGNFVDRDDAFELARDTGQMICPTDRVYGTLYSEDLW
jgi:hypothetical protein